MRKLVLATILCAVARPALALDGYQDRRGLFAGLSLGGGAVMPASGTNEFGERFALRLGGGVAENLTLDVAADFLFVPDADGRSISFYGGGQFFPVRFAFLRAALGIANLSYDAPGYSDSFAGLGFFLGGGFEMFINSDLAASFTLGYERQQFKESRSLNLVSGVIGINWY